jgi:tetratricopeptide (TPR) repeat protein
MNIHQIAQSPSILFKESFEIEEHSIPADWEQFLLNTIEDSCKIEFNSGTELLTLIELKSNCTFSANNNHCVPSLVSTLKTSSELLGSVLMSLIWIKSKKSLPKVIYSSNLYYFMSPDGEITQINSNRKRSLSNSEKFDLFNSDRTQQLDFDELIKHYFEEMCSLYIKEKKFNSLKRAQTYMIESDPKDVKWYARRGLLLKRLGQYSEALSDLKRFISFHTYEEVPESVKQALIELEGLKATDNFNSYSVH